jgi:osmotically inducible protein OsmC
MDRKAEATWSGDLKSGAGTLKVGSGAFEGPFSFISRFEGNKDTNPEELIGAALAGCFTMALSNKLAQAGTPVTTVHTTATVKLEKGDAGLRITRIDLVTRGQVPGVAEAEFVRQAEDTKVNCIVGKALAAVPMSVDARLV